MNIKILRVIIAIGIVLGVFLMAGGQSAWAESASPASFAAPGRIVSSAPLSEKGPGSVKPPPSKLTACVNDTYSVGGVVVLEITDLKPGYCVEALLWNPKFQLKRIPADAGKPQAQFLFLRIYYKKKLIHELPATDGKIVACYALPPEKTVKFFFYDFYWARFKTMTSAPAVWAALDTQVIADKKIACTFTPFSGVYALVGK
jgi:hypothetical protein